MNESAVIGPFRAVKKIILASQSPRRSDLLRSAGLEFEVIPSEKTEPLAGEQEPPAEYALRAAKAKAFDVAATHPGDVIIGADTVVAVDGRLLGKPSDEEDALSMLRTLVGKQHHVVTAVCIVCPKDDGKNVVSDIAVTTLVTMPDQQDETLRAYVATGEPMDKAGAYAIQGIGTFLVSEVEGSYTNVVGLPLARVLDVLSSCGALVPRV